MSGSIKETLGNIPAKARVVIIITGALALGAAYGFYKVISSDDTPTIGNEGKIDLSLSPNQRDIKKARPDDQIITPENSPLSEELSKIKQLEIEEAKSRSGTFIEGLRLDNEERLLSKLEAELEKKKIESDIDSILDTEEESQQEKYTREVEEKLGLKTEEQRKEERRAQEMNRLAMISEEILNEQEFLNLQLENASYDQGLMANYQSQILDYKKNMGEYTSYGSGNTNKEGKSTNSNNDDLEASDYYAKRSKSRDATSGLDRLDRYSGLLDNGAGSKDKARTSYEDSVYPVNKPSTETGAYITTGEIFYSVLEISVNTDEISPVRAIIIQDGPLKNAVLVGSPSRIGEKSVISFNKLSINGETYGINVVAVDPETMRTGIADSVDRHIFERYFKLATAAVLVGYSEALSGSSTRTYSDGSKETIRDSLPKTSEQLAYAVGKVGEKVLPKFEEEFNRPPTVKVNGNKELGIMFMEPLQLK